mmetsp:Transcript_10532/g.20243  ORF Transcript_10532/g.20243 Transcript_10532/m.20243 type:complete len:202 (-) Transcript_10532:77-682(-)
MFDTAELQRFFLAKSQDTSGCTHNNVRVFVFDNLPILFNVDSTIKDSCLDGGQIFGESFVFVGNLKGQFTGVTKHQYLHIWFFLIGRGIQLMQRRQNKDCSLSHTRLGLTNNVTTKNSLRNRFVLNLGRMFKTGIYDRTKKLRLEKKILETRGVDTNVVPLFAIRFGASRCGILGDSRHFLVFVIIDEIIFVISHDFELEK